MAEPLNAEELAAYFEAYCLKYPQYNSDRLRMRLGVMQRTWRKNGYNYLVRGQLVFFCWAGDQALVWGVYPPVIKDGMPAGVFECPRHWVRAHCEADDAKS